MNHDYDLIIPPKPYRQGRLDGLCGLYACINAQRFIQSVGRPKRRLPWRALFYDCLEHLGETWSLTDIVAYGLTSQQLWSCAKHLRDRLESKHQATSLLTRPLIGIGHRSAKQIFAKLERSLGRSDRAAILGYDGPSFSHWTTVSHIINKQLMLFDSAGTRSLDGSRFIFRNESINDIANSYHFTPTCLIVVQLPKRR